MKSEIARRLKLRYSPVAVLFADEKPDGARDAVPMGVFP